MKVLNNVKKNFNKKIKSFTLLYQTSIDVYNNTEFYRKYEGRNFTITLVINDKDKIFGGFTEIEWNQDKKLIKYKGTYFVNGFNISDKNGYDNTYDYSVFDLEGKEYVLTGKKYFSIKDYTIYQIELE